MGPSNFAIPIECRRDYQFAIRFNAVRNTRTLPRILNAVQDHWTLPYVPVQFRTVELCYVFQCSLGLSDLAIGSTSLYCSSGPSNFATWFKVVLDHRTVLYVSIAGQGYKTLPYLSIQFRTLELRRAFYGSSRPSNSAMRANAVQDSRTLVHFPMQFRTLGLCHRLNFAAQDSRTLLRVNKHWHLFLCHLLMCWIYGLHTLRLVNNFCLHALAGIDDRVVCKVLPYKLWGRMH